MSGDLGEIDMMCSICMYVPTTHDADDDATTETRVLTVKSGLMVCLRHMGCVPDDGLLHHAAMRAAVRLESRGLHDSLSAYQDAWHQEAARREEAQR